MQLIELPVIENVKSDGFLSPEEYTYWKAR